MTDEDYMREAIVQAKEASADGDWAIGAVLVQNGEIVARGRNRVYSSKDRGAHAEMDILRQMNSRLFARDHTDEMTLYTTYEPCIMCFGALLMSGIRHVVAGVDMDDSGVRSYINHIPRAFRNPPYQTTIVVGLLDRECGEIWVASEPGKRAIATGYQLAKSLDELHGEIIEYTSPIA